MNDGLFREAGLGAPEGPEPALAAAPAPPRRESLEATVARACGRVAPVWPLRRFVAVNPFLGLAGEPFPRACARLARTVGARAVMPRAFFREAVAAGRVSEGDLAAALGAGRIPGAPASLAELREALARDPGPADPVAATVAEVLDRCQGSRLAAFAVEEIGKWCAAYWDEGQSAWRMPWRDLRPYPAWLAAARLDRNPEVAGLAGFRQALAGLPEEPLAAVEAVLVALDLPAAAVEPYLDRALASVSGWAAYARFLAWEKELRGGSDDAVLHLLAVRLAWDGALFALHRGGAFRAAWRSAALGMAAAELDRPDPALAADLVLQEACERAFQRRLIATLAEPAATAAAAAERPPVQAAFCIDVRSEVYRRALETVALGVETLGFAGFFGFPIEYVPLGHAEGGAQCPVLLAPKFVVREGIKGASAEEETEILGLRLLRRRAGKAWRSFKTAAVSCFSYVETAGLLFAAKLAGDSLGLTRTVPHPSADGLDRRVLPRIGPQLGLRAVDDRRTGLAPEERVAAAEAALRGMSLTQGFARLVLIVGHGSTTVNNPHAAGLDCGACGGHTGEANARVAAAILNDPAVRAGLAARGIAVPADTRFVGALHDTTTDEVRLFDLDELPASHAEDLERLRGWLGAASALARRERAALLGIAPGERVDAAIARRGRDWSQVRPEWGLARNAAFVAAPRRRTRGRNLAGRAFLHEYDWRRDEGFAVLELVMTAPMVVASWINLQYYGSTVDNRRFGSGNKVLHNVVGTLGVLEGNGGDLRVGLPWQSLHDGACLVHEPLRLSVFLEAPEAAIDGVIARHEAVRRLVDGGWLHLFRITEEGGFRRYAGGGTWTSA